MNALEAQIVADIAEWASHYELTLPEPAVWDALRRIAELHGRAQNGEHQAAEWERLKSELAQTDMKAQILQAQLGGWEAQCAAQVLAARIYLDALADTAHDGPQLAARGRLANAIDSNVGELLLGRLQRLQLQLTRAEGLATAAAIALYELERDGTVQAHTRALLRSAVAAFEAGKGGTANGHEPQAQA